MKKVLHTGYLILFLSIKLHAQQVVVNGYFNAADPRDEWIELVVVTDNTDMRNWTVRDDNSTQTSWQTAVAFNNISFWNNMRAGTVVMIWNRPVKSDGVTAQPLDINKADGYIELDATNATYFNGGSFGSSPTWGGNSLNYAGGGDIVELRNSAGTHVHALGHASIAGADWTAMSTPKLNHANSANSGDAIYVCPGAVIGDYDGPATGNNFTSKNSATVTFGLPNTCGASASGNTTFWNNLREPAFTSQTITPSSTTAGSPGSISFSWTGATDPYPTDNTTGYIILRSTTNAFTAPSDGTTYTVGSALGGATVIAQIGASGTVSYTDNTIMIPNCYYYRIYAFRYGTDNLNGNTYNASRGRAYNTTNFAFVPCPSVLPVEWLGFTASLTGEQYAALSWSTATELNNHYFTIERSADAENFETLGTLNGSGNSTSIKEYTYADLNPLKGLSYYRITQTDYNGRYSYSSLAPLLFNSRGQFVVYPNPAEEVINVMLDGNEERLVEVLGMNDQLVKISKYSTGSFSLSTAQLPAGTYLLRISCPGCETLHAFFIRKQ